MAPVEDPHNSIICKVYSQSDVGRLWAEEVGVCRAQLLEHKFYYIHCYSVFLLMNTIRLYVCVIPCYPYMCVSSLGELDPERVGSGIQYGNAQLRKPVERTPANPSKCSC